MKYNIWNKKVLIRKFQIDQQKISINYWYNVDRYKGEIHGIRHSGDKDQIKRLYETQSIWV